MNKTDCLIVGGGPSGLFAAFYAGLRGLEVTIIEHQDRLGGKLKFYLDKIVWDIGGVEANTAANIRESMVKQGLTFDPTVHLNESVISVNKERDVFKVETTKGTHYAKTVILATGVGVFSPVKLDLKEKEDFEYENLHYYIEETKHYKDKHVLISGGGNSALDWAAHLADGIADVTLVCRKEELKGYEATIKDLETKNVRIIRQRTIEELRSNQDGTLIDRVVLSGGEEIDVDIVFVNHGYNSDSALLESLKTDVKMNEYNQILTEDRVKTGVDGLYAIGDQVHYDNRVHLIATGYPEASEAVNFAKNYIDKEERDDAIVSSHNEKFDELNKEVRRNLE